jgi:hypothetical protein
VAACLGVACVLCAVQNEMVLWQHVLGVACVLCAVQNETVVWQHVLECRVCVVCCAE